MNTTTRLATAAIWLVLAAAPALLAHAELERTSPTNGDMLTAAPTSVQLWFSEKPDLALSTIELSGPSGAVALGPLYSIDNMMAAAIKGALAPATYTVRWQTAGDDGHLQKGEFSFMVHGH